MFEYGHEYVMTVQFSTKDRILGAAEELFAQHGFATTSLRQITGHADVNVAAVNYHFGSKDNLVQEVFRRRMDQMSQERVSALKKALSTPSPSLESILDAFIVPALTMGRQQQGGHFIRVLARAYAEKNTKLRKFLSDHYGGVQREFAAAIAGVLPELSKEQLYYRLDFVSGALTYTLSEFGMIKRPPGVTEQVHHENLDATLVAFSAAGFKN